MDQFRVTEEHIKLIRRYIGEEYEDVLIERVLEEMPVIVMILCRNAEIQPGLYISDEYQQNWRRAD